MTQNIRLTDRYSLSEDTVLLNGSQALVRLMLMQKEVDRRAGYTTAGYVTGYRGSPLGAVDMHMTSALKLLEENDILFQPGLNEDLAATAVWGSQQAGLRGDGKFDGVFSLWYGKGPGVDRSGDVMRHANMAGTAPLGGALMAMGDDHTGESSTTCHQSDWAVIDASMPVLSPAGVQEILDLGLYGFALSRYAGLWAGLKLMKDTVEVTSVVDGRPDRFRFVTPDMVLPEGGLNIRLGDMPIPQEARLIDYKRHAAEAFAHANRIDRRVWGKSGAKIGFVAAGKNWLDLVHALALLGIDEARAEALGITTYKVAQTFPLDMRSFRDWAVGLDLIVVVEEKRKLIEVQIKEAIFDDRQGRRVYGWYKGGIGDRERELLFPVKMSIDPVMIATRLGAILEEEGRGSEELTSRLNRLQEAQRADNATELAARLPYFCAGCPHNTSTKVPDGSRAYAGIGCHYMALWMDRNTAAATQMGGEGANWIGEAPFSTTEHVFQNIGDGTYNHSGLMAIRAAIAAGTRITYKILYNDAVAMTGGQSNEGGLSAERIAREVLAAGAKSVDVVYDPKEEPDRRGFPSEVGWHDRNELESVMKTCRESDGVTVILYIQTCAAEKRRRRKRGLFPDPDTRIFINPEICEGCGDCGVQSNCVAITPLETELGRKRQIDQSACNKDFSCLNGFCPSFVEVTGGTPRKGAAREVDLGDLPEPALPTIDGTWNVVITGIGGTGVVTIGAVLAMAAHLDGRGAGMMEMAGLAQKGGAVHVHCRIGETPEAISAIRVATGEADVVIGGDLVVSAGAKTLGLLRTGRTGAVVNSHVTVTGDFTRDPGFRIPEEDLALALERRLQDRLSLFDATRLASVLLGDSIFSNIVVFGAAWQAGYVPVSLAAIRQAIELNGAAVERNLRAFEIGRWAIHYPGEARSVTAPEVNNQPRTYEERIAYREAHLVAYQGKRLARRYRRMLDGIEDAELRMAVAEGYHKLLAYKDEYEVARLLRATRVMAEEAFDGDLGISYHLSPPVLSAKAERPPKKRFGRGMERLFPLLARGKVLRGTPLDPFGYTSERRMERQLIREYEVDMAEAIPRLPDSRDAVLALARLPLEIRGFGPVKAANAERAAETRAALKDAIAAGPDQARAAAE
ncbi:indolepyruvate ferredoxin oxidoreductase family protein [Palleronia caenipelagi]|uniref:Indolepyruvate ferredoxin oxidoreductase family protein n=1 Tax=Palleronia caenipelagi TaxID=2489174 RepID=A0A547Q9G9_9RHOB|nr:indolepyruvate ferredoxin oxidoreductase family protein [Palleronia caenipelagi]TRD22990.1 indolepyruvate ferredoxin oxidoreductase family protein [Palleronia caenipelagi]